MHCAYRGHTSGVSLLLKRGANVNSQQESDGVNEGNICVCVCVTMSPLYSTLHSCLLPSPVSLLASVCVLAAPIYTGQNDTVDQLLGAGAATTTLNKIGKTAAQLGAFVGQHNCVQVINNYFSLSELQAFTSRVKLPLHLSQQLHKLLSTTHIHPVHVS